MRGMKRILIALLALLLAVPLNAQTPRYTIAALDPLPGETISQALALNDNGVVVGWSGSPAKPNWATVWKQGVPTLPKNTQYYTVAEGVNAAGVVVGSPSIMTGMHNGSILTGASALSIWQDATVYIPAVSNAHAINDAGQVAGDFSDQAAFWYGGPRNRSLFQWHALNNYPEYAKSAVPHLNAMSTAYAVSSTGQAAGILWSSHSFSESADNRRAFRTENGKIVLLETPKGGTSAAFAITDDGAAAGMVRSADSIAQAAVWPAYGPVQRLPPLPGLPNAVVYGVSNAGVLVGTASLLPSNIPVPLFAELGPRTDRAVLWQRGVPVELTACLPPASGWVLLSARATNSKGQIVGFGLQGGQMRAFLLSPAIP